MIQALAPRLPRGFSWGMLAIVGLGWSTQAVGQAPATKAGSPPPAANASKEKEEAKSPEDKADKSVAPREERFVDPNAKPTLAIFNPILYRGEKLRLEGAGNDITRVSNMATKVENINEELLKRYVDYFTAELTKKDNINAVIAPPANPNPKTSRGLEHAMDALTRPIIDSRARDINNPAFLNLYTRVLFDSALPKQLENNYLTRVDAMIVLGMAGGTTSQALDLYSRVLKDADQLIWVKMWAAHGLTNAAQSGRISLETSRAQLAADALVTFLKSDANLPYFARLRALEALGSVRIAAVNRPDIKLDAASAIAGYLDDPTGRVETRAWAAWALGMLRIPPQITSYNFLLAGSDIGRLAVDLGTKVIAEYDAHAAKFDDQSSTQAASLTSLLMFQVSVALAGQDGVSDSGLLRSSHPSLGVARPTLAKIDERVKAVSREAYELLRAGGVAQKSRRDALANQVADLKTFLDQNKPKDRRLVPDGPILADSAAPAP